MRHWKIRLSAAGLALSLLLGQAALASDALGHDLHSASTILSEGTAVSKGYFWSDTYKDLRLERYVSYTPNEDVHPTVAYGDNVLSRETLTTMARKLEEQGKRVVGGTNGDFYVLSTGQPLGLVVTDGVVRSSSSYHSAIGFRADGTAFVGSPNLYVSATMLGERLTVFGGINKVRQIRSADGGGLVLLTPDFGANTQNLAAGVDVFLYPVLEDLGEIVPAEETGLDRELTLSDVPRIGGRIRCVVDYVSEAAGANPIPEGGFVLTMNGKDDEGTLNMLRSLQPGDEVNIDIVSEDTRWEEAVEALGAMYRLLDNGEIGPNLNNERTARTAIGVKEDGTVIFYTIDGKQPGLSIGATCTQVAQRLRELGCIEAVGLDGGGSTTLGLTTPDQSAMAVVNSPSDGSQRSNSTAIFLTTELAATGEAGYLSIEPGDALLLAGATLPLGAYQVDTGYRLMGAATNVEYEAEGGGSVDGDMFTAGKQDAFTTITATQGKLTGTATVTTVRTPDEIVVTNEGTGGTVGALALDPGEQVSLRAACSWRNLLLQSQDGCYIWACDEEIGTIAEDGTFTAGSKTAAGKITVTAGEKTVSIPVNVAGHVLPLEDMEGEKTLFIDTESVTTQLEADLAHVRTGLQSLRVSYDAGEEGTARLTANISIPAGERYVGLWVCGDGSQNNLMALFTDGEEESLAPVCGLGFTGWKHLLLAVPEGMDTLKELQFLYGGGEERTGTVWLDQLTTANEALEDEMAPVISLKVTGDQVTAAVSDNVDRSFSAQAVILTYDGAVLSGTWNAKTDTLTAKLPSAPAQTQPAAEGEAPQPTHRVTVTAVDVSGNLGRESLVLEGDATVEFADMTDHWALSYAAYLYEQGITKGVSDGDTLYYQPNTNITRAEFFTMVARWMGLDLTQYEGTELPFADAGEIPEWAVPAVKAMYERGIVKGSLDYGVLYLYPNTGINRAEVMTILGRTQRKGYVEAELESFLDREEVPSWAESYVRSLVGQKIINGYEDGTLKPNAPMTRGEVAKVLTTLR